MNYNGGIVEDMNELAKHLIDGDVTIEELSERFPESRDGDFGASPYDDRRLAYLSQRLKGVDHVWAAMSATKRTFKTKTDRELFEGVRSLGDQFAHDPTGLQRILANAKKQGFTPSLNDMYVPGLAEFEGDKHAFVPATGGRGHIQKVCEMRNWSCDGAVTRQATDPESSPIPEGLHLDDTRATEIANNVRAIDRNAAKHDLKDVVKQVKQDHGFDNTRLCGEVSQKTVDSVKPTFTHKKKKG